MSKASRAVVEASSASAASLSREDSKGADRSQRTSRDGPDCQRGIPLQTMCFSALDDSRSCTSTGGRDRSVERTLRLVAFPAGKVQLGHSAQDSAVILYACGLNPKGKFEVAQSILSVAPGQRKKNKNKNNVSQQVGRHTMADGKITY